MSDSENKPVDIIMLTTKVRVQRSMIDSLLSLNIELQAHVNILQNRMETSAKSEPNMQAVVNTLQDSVTSLTAQLKDAQTKIVELTPTSEPVAATG